MIIFKTGNLLDEFTQALVNPVNCVGIMGKGLALDFKHEYPDNFLKYKAACDQGLIKPGMIYATVDIGSRTTHIINFPTKDHWKQPSKIEYIESGLVALVEYIQTQNITSISIPALGCGNGGLNWLDVKPKIVSAMETCSQVNTVIFEPCF